MSLPAPKYSIGEFVRCSYDLVDFYFYLYEEEHHPYFKYYGIVVDIAYDEMWYELEPVYKIYCMDGFYRFFLEDEIVRV